ncbi:hypothetical protein SDRG_15278 [Saprolegnia diclina VS20]|uniref:Uncharacterized protein n=1 Tax=Saprolegnia diclina (strain VS20) TaxID=1156394 RepID=T0RBN5_SAPDV|nr:hypothetical protein SDRG_15278 [Saprolegnia diclina VS20]EQC26947.1 hypothetical protein SDRG_15278 [Saprolegnia diclina VS20]|eukprot:XP_008619668.1 hypothetical protein SDRG_15278 [Saprolegnia diclina VS20]
MSALRATNPTIAAYEAALDLLRDSTAYAYQSTVAWHLQPQLTIDGVDGCLSWSMTLLQEQQLRTRYAHYCILPTSKVRILNEDAWATIVRTSLLPDVQQALRVTDTGVVAVFSHLCIDTHGSSMCLKPRPDIANVFGMLLVSLPSCVDGGEIATAFGGGSTVQRPSRQTVQVLATRFNATITSSPVRSGRRVALVYALVATDMDARAIPPLPTHDDAVTAFEAIAAHPPSAQQRLGVLLERKLDNLSFECLPHMDAAVVDALIATRCFDVALVRLGGHTISVATPHHACAVPADVLSCLPGKRIDTLLGAVHGSSSPHAIAFWLMPYRAGLVGRHAALTLAQTATTDTERLGLSARELLRGILTTFLDTGTSSHCTMTARDMHAMTNLLIQHRHVDLAASFLRNVVSNARAISIQDLATCVQSCLATFGWTLLFPAVKSLLRRWLRVRKLRDSTWLLLSLAGVTTGDDAVCRPLRQPYVCELVKLSWAQITPRVLTRDAVSFPAEHWILFDWYLDEVAPPCVYGNWLGTRLPPPLTLLVDSFLYCRPFGSVLSGAHTSASWLLQHVPRGLVRAIASQPTLSRRRYLDVVSVAIGEIQSSSDSVHHSVSSTDVGAMLDAMHSLGQCTVRLLDACQQLSSNRSVVAGVLRFLQHPTSPVSSSTHSLVAEYVVSIAAAFTNGSGAPRTARDGKAFVDVIAVLTLAAPSNVPSFLSKWLAALPATLDTTRSVLYPVVEQLRARFQGIDLDLVAQVATACLARFLDGDALAPVPDFGNDFVLADIAVDAKHCEQCGRLARFLQNGLCAEYDYAAHVICAQLEALVDDHADELALELDERDDDAYGDPYDEFDDFDDGLFNGSFMGGYAQTDSYVVRKLVQPGRATVDDLDEYHRRIQQLKDDTKRIAMFDDVLATHAAAMDEDEPTPKRPRHDAP